jgi:uncharacterized protein YbjQ (UPF0145 family)
MTKEFLVVTTDEVPGYKVKKVLGTVKGSTVRSRNIARDIGAGLKNLVGGELEAIQKGANAIVGMRFMTSMIMQGASEMLAFGTAVELG